MFRRVLCPPPKSQQPSRLESTPRPCGPAPAARAPGPGRASQGCRSLGGRLPPPRYAAARAPPAGRRAGHRGGAAPPPAASARALGQSPAPDRPPSPAAPPVLTAHGGGWAAPGHGARRGLLSALPAGPLRRGRRGLAAARRLRLGSRGARAARVAPPPGPGPGRLRRLLGCCACAMWSGGGFLTARLGQVRTRCREHWPVPS